MAYEAFIDRGIDPTEGAIEVRHISCDGCGLIDDASVFPYLSDDPVETARFKATLLQFEIDYDGNPQHQSAVQTEYAGACCPGCGNYSSLDMDPYGTAFSSSTPTSLVPPITGLASDIPTSTRPEDAIDGLLTA